MCMEQPSHSITENIKLHATTYDIRTRKMPV